MEAVVRDIKIIFGGLVGVVSCLVGGIDVLFGGLLVCMAIDYATGVLSAVYEKKLDSRVGFRGILKKAVILMIVVLTHSLEGAVGVNGVRDLVVGFYIANEGISILENGARMNVPYCRKLQQVLEQLQEK